MLSFFLNIKQERQKIERSTKEMELHHDELAKRVKEGICAGQQRLEVNRQIFDEQSKRVHSRIKTASIQNK